MSKQDELKKEEVRSSTREDAACADTAGAASQREAGPQEAGPQEAGPEETATLADLEAQVAEMEAALSKVSEQLATVTAERDTWQTKATGIYDQYLRAKSDLESYRKRTDRDFDDRLTRAKADYLRSVLEVLDNFDRFLQAAGDSGQEGGTRSFDAFYKGVSMVHRQLVDTLAKEGVEPMEDPVGKPMDPAYHEAVVAEDGGEHGTVLEVLQKGYVYRGLVLRVAKVKVAR